MSTITGFLIRTDGTAEAVEVASDGHSNLEHMRALVAAAYVDVIGIENTYGAFDAWVDDEGAYTAIPNVAATVILSELAGQSVPPIFGHALLLSRADAEAAGLDAAQLEYVQALHALAQAMPQLRASIDRAYAEAALSGRR